MKRLSWQQAGRQVWLGFSQVLVYAYKAILALLHPMTPFITETLWQALPHRGPALIAAPWPTHSGAIDASALDDFQVRSSQLFTKVLRIVGLIFCRHSCLH